MFVIRSNCFSHLFFFRCYDSLILIWHFSSWDWREWQLRILIHPLAYTTTKNLPLVVKGSNLCSVYKEVIDFDVTSSGVVSCSFCVDRERRGWKKRERKRRGRKQVLLQYFFLWREREKRPEEGDRITLTSIEIYRRPLFIFVVVVTGNLCLIIEVTFCIF